MKQLIIIGAGGMGRSMYCIAQDCRGYGSEFIIKGFIDDNLHSMDGFDGYPPVLSPINDYPIEDDDFFYCSIGNAETKREICESLKQKGARFLSLIHNASVVRQNTVIGDGTFIAGFATVGADVTIGENVLIQSYSVVGHDCKIGNYVRIDTHCVCVGGVVVEDEAMIHTAAVVSHKVVVGKGAHVAACSFVIRKVKPGTTVFGNPAKLLR